MCGLLGMTIHAKNGFSVKQETIVDQLLYVGALRGDDSTGVIGVENDTTFHIAKEATAAAWFQNSLAVDSTLGKKLFSSGKAFIGHNRKKTIGSATDENAHPFVVNTHFAMVHNGTLVGHKKLANTTVDSEALAIVLEEAFGKKDKVAAIETTLSRVVGAYALSIYDQRSNCIHLLRNAERPMSYVETSDAVYWASEAGMLWWILSRNGVNCSEIKELPVDTLLTISLDTNKLTLEPLEIKKPLPHTATVTGRPTNGVSTTNPPVTPISKSRLKKVRKSIGKTIAWFPNTFVSSLIEGGTKECFLGSGECLDYMFDHEIRGVFVLPEKEHIADYDGIMLYGVINGIHEDNITGRPIIWVNNITHTKGKRNETVPPMSTKLTKEQQLEESRRLSVFNSRVQSVTHHKDEHETEAV